MSVVYKVNNEEQCVDVSFRVTFTLIDGLKNQQYKHLHGHDPLKILAEIIAESVKPQEIFDCYDTRKTWE